jgi:glutaminyl-peptide cyclotransferase
MRMRNRTQVLQWLRGRWLEIALLLGLIAVLAWFATIAQGFLPRPAPTPTPPIRAGEFSGASALSFLRDQVGFGPRPVGSENARKTGDYILDRLAEFGWATEVQEFTHLGVSGRNIIAKAGTGPVAIIGAHYDTRRKADRDPDPGRREEPILGANDGASGVAVLLELARSLDRTKLANEVWLVFFDAEDNGGLEGWDFSVGSEFMAANLSTAPAMVVVVDMIGDSDQDIYKERNSTPELVDRIWSIASGLGYEEQFLPKYGMSIIDDHIPFLRRGYPAVDLIDFNYPYWHTTQDTLDKVSAASLERVGRVLQTFLETGPLKSSDVQNSSYEEQPE